MLRRIGHIYGIVLTAVLADASVWAAIWSFQEKYHEGDTYFAVASTAIAFCWTLAVVSAILLSLLHYGINRSSRMNSIHGGLVVLLGLSFIIGGFLGDRAWWTDFSNAREKANEIVEALSKYKTERGHYPPALAELGYQEPVLLRIGKSSSILEYSRGPEDYFEFRYGAGWYGYSYDSHSGNWETEPD